MLQTIHVALLDDHQSVIDGYRYRLSQYPDIEIVAEAHYGEELPPLLNQHSVDLLILDVSVPTSEKNPNPYPILHLIPTLLEAHPGLRILIISQHPDRALVRAILDSGASGYLLKDDFAAIRRLGELVALATREDGLVLSEALVDKLPERGVLTKGQQELLSYIAAHPDATLQAVGLHFGRAHTSVRNKLTNAYLRLNVTNKTEAVMVARQRGLITPFESLPESKLLRGQGPEGSAPAG